MNIQCRTPNIESRTMVEELLNWKFAVRCSIFSLLSSACILLLPGCQKPVEGPSPADQIEQLTQEKAQLQRQIEQTATENNELKGRVQVLSSLPGQARLESLSPVKSIDIGRYTNFYDKDKDGRKEKFIVYIQPIDADGDKVKAAGEVDVQLWNLNNADGKALLGSWHVGPDELKKLWFATIVTINYRLTFDIPEAVKSLDEPMTVKVTFKDHLTGKTFKEQKVIEPLLGTGRNIEEGAQARDK
ncbi:MAG: hypothetical protein ABIF19_11775 [Planctomycetota bacterium]